MNEDINLTEENDKEEPSPNKPVTADMMESQQFPELHVRNVADDALTGLPDDGHFSIKGKIVHRETHTHPRTGKKTHSFRMKVHSIRHTGVHKSEHKKDMAQRLEAADFPSNASH